MVIMALLIVGAYISKYYKENKKITQSLLIYIICALIVTVFSLKVGRAWDY